METLTNEQLCALAQAGDAEAVETIIEKNRPYVQQLAKRLVYNPIRSELFASWGIDQDDLVQVGLIGLWKAIDNFDPAKESKFLTYAGGLDGRHSPSEPDLTTKCLGVEDGMHASREWRLLLPDTLPRKACQADFRSWNMSWSWARTISQLRHLAVQCSTIFLLAR